MRLVRGSHVAFWAGERLGCAFEPPYEAIGIMSAKQQLIGAAIFNSFQERNVEMTCVGRGAFQRGVMRELFGYAFNELDCRRLTLRTRAKNSYVRFILEKYHCQHEGTLRNWYDDDDCVIYGLLKEDCVQLCH